MQGWPKRLAQIAGGILVCLVIAEGALRYRDHGAFPNLHLYVPDERLGVRLRPGSSQRLWDGQRAGDREALERLCRYGARPCFSLERLSVYDAR